MTSSIQSNSAPAGSAFQWKGEIRIRNLVFLLLCGLIVVGPLGQGGESADALFWKNSCLAGMFCAWVLCKAREPGPWLHPFGFERILIAYFALCGLSYVLSTYRYSTSIELVQMILYVLLFYMLLDLLTESTVPLLLGCFVASGVVQSLLCVAQHYFLQVSRPAGSFFSPNLAATYVLATAAVAMVLLVRSGSRKWTRLPLGLSVLLLLWALTITGSRSAAISFVPLIGFSFVLLGRKHLLISLSFALAGALLMAIPNPLSHRLFHEGAIDIYSMDRPKIWLQGLRMMLDHPILGVTLGNFEYSTFRYLFPVEETVGRYAKVFSDADNTYVGMAAELGIPGLICVLAMGAVVGWKLIRGYRARQDREARLSLVAAGLALTVLASQAVFHDVAHSPPNAFLGLCSVAIIGVFASLREPGGGSPRTQSLRRIIEDLQLRRWFAWFVVVTILAVLWPSFCLRTWVANRHYETATAYWKANAPLAAQRELEKGISYNPSQAFYWDLRGHLAMERFSEGKSMDEARAALDSFSKAVSLNPVYPPLHFTLGKCYEFLVPFMKEREVYVAHGIESYRNAIELSPRNCFYRVRLAALHMKVQDWGLAIVELKEALALEPKFVAAMYLLAEAYVAAGDEEGARVTRETMNRTMKDYRDYRPRNVYERNLLLDPGVYMREQLG
jgi:O-antigen ligase